MNDLISIIVPAFNIAKDLRQCVESILAQTYANWELILINDASYDQTGELCREFESKDERIKLIELATQHGVATARNIGIKAANGEYLTFIDGDDFVSPTYLAHLYEQAQLQQADIAVGAYYELNEQRGEFLFYITEEKQQGYIVSTEEILQRINENRFKTACCKLYKRSLFDEVYFPDGRLIEDIETMSKLYMAAKQIVLLNENLYCIRQRQNSTTRRLHSLQYIRDNLDAHFELLTDFVVNGYDPQPVIKEMRYVMGYFKNYLENQGLTNVPIYHRVKYYYQTIAKLKKNFD